jgi:hypothetical protein
VPISWPITRPSPGCTNGGPTPSNIKPIRL